MKTKIYDKDSGEVVGEINIPDEVMDAARLVSEWMESQSDSSVELYGLKLAD
jgi:hypothetical protein